jgi:hypothetical protein
MLSYYCSMEFTRARVNCACEFTRGPVNCVYASHCLHVSAFATSTTSELIFTPAHTPPSLCGGVLRAETEESDRACPARIKQHARNDFILEKEICEKKIDGSKKINVRVDNKQMKIPQL